jgi:CRISPR system Cascade subunit CasD
MGKDRGSAEEKEILKKFSATKLTCVALPIKTRWKNLAVKRMQDYHTVQNTRDAKGKIKGDAVLTYRQYLNDAMFFALFQGEKNFLHEVANNLQNPVWGVWLGRKSCIPSAPLFAGNFSSLSEAVKGISEFDGKSLEQFDRVEDVSSFNDGIDSYMDLAESFDIQGRKFSQRRVMLMPAQL